MNMLFVSLEALFSPPDQTLTPANIIKAVRGMPLWESVDSYHCLDMPESLHNEIARSFRSKQAKRELIKEWHTHHPLPCLGECVGTAGVVGEAGSGGEREQQKKWRKHT